MATLRATACSRCPDAPGLTSVGCGTPQNDEAGRLASGNDAIDLHGLHDDGRLSVSSIAMPRSPTPEVTVASRRTAMGTTTRARRVVITFASCNSTRAAGASRSSETRAATSPDIAISSASRRASTRRPAEAAGESARRSEAVSQPSRVRGASPARRAASARSVSASRRRPRRRAPPLQRRDRYPGAQLRAAIAARIRARIRASFARTDSRREALVVDADRSRAQPSTVRVQPVAPAAARRESRWTTLAVAVVDVPSAGRVEAAAVEHGLADRVAQNVRPIERRVSIGSRSSRLTRRREVVTRRLAVVERRARGVATPRPRRLDVDGERMPRTADVRYGGLRLPLRGSAVDDRRPFAGRARGLADPAPRSSSRSVGVLAQEVLGGLAALTEALLAVGVPGAGLGDDALLDAEVEQASPPWRCPCRT